MQPARSRAEIQAMSGSRCRSGLHRWTRKWGDDGSYLECRYCGAPATRTSRSWSLLGRGLILLAAAAVVAGVAGTAYALTRPGPQPNYSLAPTAKCLRAHGYSVSHPFHGDFGRRTVEIVHHRHFWLVSFTASAAQAQRNASTDPYGIPTRRNVVFDIEGVGLLPRDMPVVDCLRSQ